MGNAIGDVMARVVTGRVMMDSAGDTPAHLSAGEAAAAVRQMSAAHSPEEIRSAIETLESMHAITADEASTLRGALTADAAPADGSTARGFHQETQDLQNRLNELGFACGSDGVWGPETRAALNRFVDDYNSRNPDAHLARAPARFDAQYVNYLASVVNTEAIRGARGAEPVERSSSPGVVWPPSSASVDRMHAYGRALGDDFLSSATPDAVLSRHHETHEPPLNIVDGYRERVFNGELESSRRSIEAMAARMFSDHGHQNVASPSDEYGTWYRERMEHRRGEPFNDRDLAIIARERARHPEFRWPPA